MKQVLSPRELADAIGVSESSLKRWADDGLLVVSRTAGGHRRIAITEAIRFVRESGLPVLKPHVLGIRDPGAVSALEAPHAVTNDAVRQALLAGDAERARGLIMSLYLGGMSVAEICDGPIAGAMREIGELWKHGPEGIFVEHRASDVCVQALSHMRALLPPPPDNAPVAMGGSLDGDNHMLPSLMAAVVLASDGWRETNLGGNTPPEVFAIAAKQSGAKLVWISCSVDQSAEALMPRIRQVAAALEPTGATLTIGGRGVPKKLRDLPPRTHLVASMSELQAFARGMVVGSGKTK